MLIVAVKNRVVVIHYNGGARKQVFEPGGKPREAFFFEPDQVISVGLEERSHAFEITVHKGGHLLSLTCVKPGDVLISE